MESSTSVVYVEPTSMSPRKKTVIDILRSRPDFVSGQEISESLGVSRNAVHKHIKSLRKRGYRITGVSRRGYLLEEEPSILSMQTVARLTKGSMFGTAFRYFDEIESTNDEAKRLAAAGAPEGTVVVSESQSSGRGRRGRRWTSPAGKGILFSAVLRPRLTMGDAHLLTLLTGVAVAEAIEAQIRTPVHLKWPNDLIIDNRKGGGVLLEISGEYDRVDWVIVGVGVNVNTEFAELPAALRRSATSLKIAAGHYVDRSTLLARILVTLERHYRSALDDSLEGAISAFRERDYLLHRSVSVETREGPVLGEAVGIDDRGALLVKLPDRRTRRFHSGDVTLHQ